MKQLKVIKPPVPIKAFLAAPYARGDSTLTQALRSLCDDGRLTLVQKVGSAGTYADVRQHLKETIKQADVVVADISDSNPNVLWELGFAEALQRPVIVVAEDGGNIPFDLRAVRVLLVSGVSSVANVASRLGAAIEAAMQGTAGQVVAGMAQGSSRTKVFLSYSHRDAEYLDRILVHLRPMERSGLIDQWSDTKIRAGDRWKDEIRTALAVARIAVLLVSADFLASEFIATNELPPLLEAAEREGLKIIPLIVKPSGFLRHPELARFHALNDPRRPIIGLSEAEREEIYAELAETIALEAGNATASAA